MDKNFVSDIMCGSMALNSTILPFRLYVFATSESEREREREICVWESVRGQVGEGGGKKGLVEGERDNGNHY